MGGFNAFESLNPAQVVSIREFSRKFLTDNARRPQVALDMSNHIVQVSSELRSRSEGVAHHLLFQRLTAYVKIGIDLLCVFDGPLTDEKRRHATLLPGASVAEISVARQFSPMIQLAKSLCRIMGLPVIEAPAEAEALCAWLQRNKYVDAVFSSDADVLANGATCVIRYVPQPSLSSWELKSSAAEERLVEVYELDMEDAPRFSMMALILGNDWSDGLRGIGKTTAAALAQPHTTFASQLLQICQIENFVAKELKRIQWRNEFVHEMTTNEHNWLNRKCNQPVPVEFPDLGMFARLVQLNPPYDRDLINACQNVHRLKRPLDSTDSERIKKLEHIWTQPCPGMPVKPLSPSLSGGRSPTSSSRPSPGEVSSPETFERSLRMFKSTLGSLLLANMLLASKPVPQQFEFKEMNKRLDVEVVAEPTSPPWIAGVFKGVRVPRYIFDLNPYASYETKKTRARSAGATIAPKSRSQANVQKAVKQNSKITQFFTSQRTLSAPTAMKRKIERVPLDQCKRPSSAQRSATADSDIGYSHESLNTEEDEETDVDEDPTNSEPIIENETLIL